MKNRGYHRFVTALVFCLLTGVTAGCERGGTAEEQVFESMESDPAADTVESCEEDSRRPMEDLLTEESTSTEYDMPVQADDEETRNLLSLRNGDTQSLVGVSFGDVFDYDNYVDKGSWDGEAGGLYFLFNGKGNGLGVPYSDIPQAPQYKQKHRQCHGT